MKMKHELLEELLQNYRMDQKELIRSYELLIRNEISSLSSKEIYQELLSEVNYRIRRRYKSSELVGFRVRVGDICFIDFGKSYINEAGYQHFGVVLNTYNSKILVVPMSSNPSMYDQAYCEKVFPHGKKHLMRLELVEGLERKSVLFLNDLKFINSARVIGIKAHLSQNSPTFIEIKKRVAAMLTQLL
jgi:PemK-like protein.